MLVGSYRFNCEFITPAIVPEYKGSMLRGAFGHALKKTVCALRRQQCDTCLLTESCAYSFIFETRKSSEASDRSPARMAALPHPYVLEPPSDVARSYKTGEPFSFGLILFGRANDFLPHIVYTVEKMGETGLGRGTGADKGRFALRAVSEGETQLYDGSSKILTRSNPVPDLTLLPAPDRPVPRLFVKLITPLRLKHQNQLQDDLPFHLLIRAALRRISSLEAAYGNGEPDLDYRGLVERAAQVRTVRSDCCWVDLGRYSNRQQTAMLMGGVQGNITYAGDLAGFLPLLRYCEKTHLGKQTVFGLGRMTVEEGE